MIKGRESNKKLLYTFGWIVFLSSYFTFYGTFNEVRLENFFNGDILGIPSLFKDIIEDGGNIKDWQLASAPCFFPDFTIYYILNLLFSGNFIFVFFFYGLIQTSLVIFLTQNILRKALPEYVQNSIWLVPVFYSFTLIESYYFTHHDFFASMFIFPAYHIGPLIMGLISISVYLSNYKLVKKCAILFILTFVASFNDLLFVVIFVAPFILALMFNGKEASIKERLLYFINVLIACLTGIFSFNFISVNHFANFKRPNRIFSFGDIASSLEMFLDQMGTYISLPGFRSVQLIITFLLPLFLFGYFLKRKHVLERKFKFLIVFYSGFSFLVILTPIINGSYTGWDIVRYFLSTILFSMGMFAIIYTMFLNITIKSIRTRTVIAISLPLILILLNLIKFSPSTFLNYFTYYPAKVKELDSLSVSNNLTNGVGMYWNTKFITLFSKRGINVNAIHPNGPIYEFASNINWYYNRKYNFIIADKLKMEEIKKYYLVEDTIKSKSYTIYKVKEFYFPKREYFPKLVDTLKNI